VLQVELNLISADPGLPGDPIRYLEATFPLQADWGPSTGVHS
jgi:hypothetical protein